MELKMLGKNDAAEIDACARLLVECFEHSWDTLEEGLRTVEGDLDEGIVIAAVEEGRVLGFAGALPQYAPNGWELHPLAVAKAERRRGIGSKLVSALECEVRRRGAIVMYLGADDEGFETTLGGTDLFEDTFGKIAAIGQVGNHPFQFYERCGYKIVGVLPDVNGWGKPDILMAKRLQSKR